MSAEVHLLRCILSHVTGNTELYKYYTAQMYAPFRVFSHTRKWNNQAYIFYGATPRGGPRSHTQGFTITFRQAYSVGLLWRLISPMQRPISDKTQHSPETRHPCTRRDSNPQSQQASGRKPTPYTARRQTSAIRLTYRRNTVLVPYTVTNSMILFHFTIISMNRTKIRKFVSEFSVWIFLKNSNEIR